MQASRRKIDNRHELAAMMFCDFGFMRHCNTNRTFINKKTQNQSIMVKRGLLMKRIHSKKASLSLSMNAIVVVVLAFAMLGLGLAVTNMIFNSISIPEIPKPGIEAGPRNPIAIESELKIKRDAQVNLEFSYYNKGDSTQFNARPIFSSCYSDDGTEIGAANPKGIKLPTYAGAPINVNPGTSVDYKGILSIRDSKFLGENTYICTLSIVNMSGTIIDQTFEQKQVFLRITS
jgi:hypothetical protein